MFHCKYLSIGTIIIPIFPIYIWSDSGSWGFIQLGCNGTWILSPTICLQSVYILPWYYILLVCVYTCIIYIFDICIYIYTYIYIYIFFDILYNLYIICIQYLEHFIYSIYNSIYIVLMYIYIFIFNISPKNWSVHRFAIRRMAFMPYLLHLKV